MNKAFGFVLLLLIAPIVFLAITSGTLEGLMAFGPIAAFAGWLLSRSGK